MPVQIWTPGQVLTAAELTTITNLLPFPVVTTVNVNPAVLGNFYRAQPTGAGTITITLPSPSVIGLVGAKLDAAASAGTVVVQRNASELIYVPVAAGATRGVNSVTLTDPDSYMLLVSDGSNWHVVSMAPAPQAINYYEQTGGATSGIAGTETTIATLVVPAQGFPYRAKVSYSCFVGSSDSTSQFRTRIRRDTANTGTLLRESIGYAGSGSIPPPIKVIDVDPDASLNVFGSVIRYAGSGTGQTFADALSDVLLAEVVPL